MHMSRRISRQVVNSLLYEMADSSLLVFFVFFFQAEDGIRDVERSRGLGDVYKRQPLTTGVSWVQTWKSGVKAHLRYCHP